jgi:hypothetical protein
MKVIDILLEQQINSIASLRDAFNVEQWYNILSYYNLGRLERASAAERGAFLSRANGEVGSGSNTYMSLSDWLLSANRYNLKFDRNVTVQDIYNELAPHANRKVIDYSNEEPVADRGMDDDHTVETFEQFQAWAPTDATSFGTTREAYNRIIAIEDAIKENRGDEWFNLVQRLGQLNENWNEVSVRIYERVRTRGSISKRDLDSELYGWLRVADYAVYTHRQNQGN